MIRKLGLYTINQENAKKFCYTNKPPIRESAGNFLRQKFEFFPAPERFEGKIEYLDRMVDSHLKAKSKVDFNFFTLKTPMGNMLDSIEIVPNYVTPRASYIINIFGAVDSYEQNIGYMVTQSEEVGCINIGFNLPGVAKSTGILDSYHTCIEAGVAQAIRLIEQGVPPKKIRFSGHSLGASFAVDCASYLESVSLDVKVLHRFGFGNSAKAAAAYMVDLRENRPGKPNSPVHILSTETLVFGTANLAGWYMDTNQKYNTIKSNSLRDYMVCKPNKIDRRLMTADEMVIERASLHFMQKPQRRFIKTRIIEAIKLSTNKSNIDKICSLISEVSKNNCGSFESSELLKRIEKRCLDIKNRHETSGIVENYFESLNIAADVNKIDVSMGKLQNQLKNYYNTFKHERKFIVNTKKLIEDSNNPQIVRKRYNERCDRFLLDRGADVIKNLKEIGKYEPYFAKWLSIGLLFEDKMKTISPEKFKELTIEKDTWITELAKKMDIHAIHTDYLITRKEKPGPRFTGTQYYNNLIKTMDMIN